MGSLPFADAQAVVGAFIRQRHGAGCAVDACVCLEFVVAVAELAIPFLLALLPIIWLVVALVLFKLPAWKAACGSFVLACVLAFAAWKLPMPYIATASLEGWATALWPIVLVIIAAVFTYNLCVRTGAMDVIGSMITSLSSDRRVLALLVAWCFGGFMEGMSGFGTGIAIPAGMLAALGFKPLQAVLMCLVANGIPTCFGSVGVPTVSLAGLTGLDVTDLAVTEMMQVAPFYVLIPFIVVLIAGEGDAEEGAQKPSFAARLHDVTLTTLVSGVAYALPAFAVAALMGPELVVVVGSLCSLMATAICARVLRPSNAQFEMKVEAGEPVDLRGMVRAWACFILIFVLLLGTSKLVAPVNAWFAQFSSQVVIYSGPNPAVVSFSWGNTPGVWIFISAFSGGLIQGARPRLMAEVFFATVKQMLPTAITMLAVLGCAKVMGYAGMISAISAFCIAVTGTLFPALAPVIGAIGAFVTGSGTSSGLLFGTVQQQAAEALQVDPYWMVSLNSLGVGAGKIISPQSLAIGLAAVGRAGAEGKLLARALPIAAVLMVLMAVFGFAGTLL